MNCLGQPAIDLWATTMHQDRFQAQSRQRRDVADGAFGTLHHGRTTVFNDHLGCTKFIVFESQGFLLGWMGTSYFYLKRLMAANFICFGFDVDEIS